MKMGTFLPLLPTVEKGRKSIHDVTSSKMLPMIPMILRWTMLRSRFKKSGNGSHDSHGFEACKSDIPVPLPSSYESGVPPVPMLQPAGEAVGVLGSRPRGPDGVNVPGTRSEAGIRAGWAGGTGNPAWVEIESSVLGGRVVIVPDKSNLAAARRAHPHPAVIYCGPEVEELGCAGCGGGPVGEDMVKAIYKAKEIFRGWVVPNGKEW